MKNKLILLVFFRLSSFTLSYGQTSSEYTSGISQFLNWVSDLETVLLNITDKEELKTIDRQLGYA